MADYNLEIANSLAKYYKQLTGIDYKSTRRTPKDAYLRSLFYKILVDLNEMNDRMISEYFEKVYKTHRNRASIYHSLLKIDVYYTNYKEFRDFYDNFFLDKADIRDIEDLRQKRIKRKAELEQERLYKLKIMNRLSESKKRRIALDDLIATIDDNRIEEIKEMISLRIKSWSWKAKNEYQIIECSGSLEGSTF